MSFEPISIYVPVEAVPFARAGSHGKRRFTPSKQANYMGVIRMYADRAMEGRAPLEGAIRVNATFFYTRPASWSAKKKAVTNWKTSKPDLDNLQKIILDSLNGCVYLDDAQIAEMQLRKLYDDKPAIMISIFQLEAA